MRKEEWVAKIVGKTMTVTLKREREIEGVRVEGLDRDEGD
jgi:hypothetical protein